MYLTPTLAPPFTDGGEIWWHWTNLSAPGRLWDRGHETDWVSRNPDAHFYCEADSQGHIRCIANVSYDDGLTSTPIDIPLALVIVADLEMYYGSTETIPTWGWDHNSCGCRILYASTSSQAWVVTRSMVTASTTATTAARSTMPPST